MNDVKVIRVDGVVAGYRPARALPSPFAECAEHLREALSMLEGASEEVLADDALRREFRRDVARSVFLALVALDEGELAGST